MFTVIDESETFNQNYPIKTTARARIENQTDRNSAEVCSSQNATLPIVDCDVGARVDPEDQIHALAAIEQLLTTR